MNSDDIYKICDDWRIMGQPGYLFQKKIIFKKFIPYMDSEHPEHAHCEFCNDYFSQQDNYLKEGFYEPYSKSWICEQCVNDFKQLFQWDVEDGSSS